MWIEDNFGVVLILGILFIIGIASIASAMTFINPGQRGVVVRLGKVMDVVFDEGFHWKTPFIERVDKMDVKTQRYDTQADAATLDLQILMSDIALNFRLKPESVANMRKTIGTSDQIRSKIIEPAIQEAIKAITATFTAEEVITKRPVIRDQMKLAMQEKIDQMSDAGILIVEFNVVNFEFGQSFADAIEAKVTAEQRVLEEEHNLNRIIVEAQQKIERAKAEAESIRIQAEALGSNPAVLNLRWIEKWNGVLPITLLEGGGNGTGILLSVG
jgi:regulator of protease activity HflC (stomatin/prohibitin superfamily)